MFTTNQITSALAAYRSAADQDTATASSIAAALLSYYTIAGLLWVGHRPLAKNIKEIEAQHPRSLARRHSLFSGCRKGKSASADIWHEAKTNAESTVNVCLSKFLAALLLHVFTLKIRRQAMPASACSQLRKHGEGSVFA